jgi:hypothetical protein
MKHMVNVSVAVVLFGISALAAAQIPDFPYNPDQNGDGWIGVVDLQGLLALYGLEFESVVVSEDDTQAIMLMGNNDYPSCFESCRTLPGEWRLPALEELVLVWDDVYTTDDERITWIRPQPNQITQEGEMSVFFSGYGNGYTNHMVQTTPYPTQINRCYCATRENRDFEYQVIDGSLGDGNAFEVECQQAIEDGWFPFQSPAITGDGNLIEYRMIQAFWRYAVSE